MRWRIGVACLCAALGCGGETDFSTEERAALLALSNPPAPPEDRSNAWATDPRAQRLGQRLFFDPNFAGPPSQVDALGRNVPHARPAGADGRLQLSCADCHALRAGGSDHQSVPSNISVGAGWTPVNALGVVNAAYYDLMFWNGRADSLWGMIVPVVESKVSMNGNRLALAWRMLEVYGDAYAEIFGRLPFEENWAESQARLLTAADGSLDPMRCGVGFDGRCPPPACFVREGVCLLRFPRGGRTSDERGACLLSPGVKPDPWTCMLDGDAQEITRVAVNFSKAIAAYEMLLTSTDALFDKHMRGAATMSPAAIRGARLFVGKAACVECHSGPMLTDQRFHNIGVPQRGMGAPLESDCPAGSPSCDCVTPKKCQPWGRFEGLLQLKASKFLRSGSYSDAAGPSPSSYELEASSDAQKGAWRTPSLRNVALTAPYMHNGAFATLEEVIEHYDQGGTVSGAAASERSRKLAPLSLSADEKSDLIAFLLSLTGDPLPVDLSRPPP